MQKVFVVDKNGKPLMPCSPKRCRELRATGRTRVYRLKPFTIQLIDREGGETQEIEYKVDAGSKTTGLALVGKFERQGNVVLWAANLQHRGHLIKDALQSRVAARRSRRSRKTRYRKPRFAKVKLMARKRPEGWLPPSLMSRVNNITNWLNKLMKYVPVTKIVSELVRFDLQKLVNPEISGIEYQQGTLQGYEVKEYLLEKWGRACVYCGKDGVPLQVEHIHPKAKGGTNRIGNLTISCAKCNEKKSVRSIGDFLSGKPALLKKIKAQMTRPLKDATAVNATRWKLKEELECFGLPVELSSGGRTKFNRTQQGYKKDHWLDAACVGSSGESVSLGGIKPLQIKAMGRGDRKVVGIPLKSTKPKVRSVGGFKTGCLAILNMPRGKYQGQWIGRICNLRDSNQSLAMKTSLGECWTKVKNFTLLQHSDGYEYA